MRLPDIAVCLDDRAADFAPRSLGRNQKLRFHRRNRVPGLNDADVEMIENAVPAILVYNQGVDPEFRKRHGAESNKADIRPHCSSWRK